MKKLDLNKKTVSRLDQQQMNAINGGDWSICLASCKRGTRKDKNCCTNDSVILSFIE
ncbi:class I lanthipeptide [Flavobacteriaceae bacterium M23B6Z8]